ncbi:ADP-ribosylglycohydrolase family protein [Streptomyces sp. NPDC051940]|uniref:ADP-ribosylglycohydrolase family protein n=1 Tax=Streptomyces sp. NPDC051940 TaxID=3155675 RepID=UPI003420F2AD
MLRLTWVQPEDLVGHELRQAAQDGRDASPLQARWLAAGGHLAPSRAGSSPSPAPRALRQLALELLDELASLRSPLSGSEPSDWHSLSALLTHPGPLRYGPTLVVQPGTNGCGPAAPTRAALRHACPQPTQPDTPAAVSPAGLGEVSDAVSPAGLEEESDAVSPARPGGESDAVSPARPGEERDALRPARPGGESDAVSPARPGEERDALRPARPGGESDAVSPARPGEERDALRPARPGEEGDAAHQARPAFEDKRRQARSRGLGAQPPGSATAPDQARPAFEDERRQARSGGLGAQPPGSGTAPRAYTAPHTDRPALQARLHAAWLGRAAGCLLGKPVEKLPLEGIRALAQGTGNWPLTTWFTEHGLDRQVAAQYPWNRRSRPTSLAENIDGMPEDDDLNYPLLGLRLLETHGHTFTTTDVARLWLDELPAGRTFTAERIAYRNLLDGVEPPHTATHRNPFREWIGALIRADVFGWTNPGDPARAAEEAHRDAILSHTANGVYGAMWAAATIAAAAAGQADVHEAIQTGLDHIPQDSRLAHAITHARELARTTADFDDVVDRLHTRYGHDHHWVHVIPNTALVTAALTHADGDYTGSITKAVSGGWDTDSNGATAGSVAALLAGSPAALPARWTEPLKNRLASSITGFDGIGFDALARRTMEVCEA